MAPARAPAAVSSATSASTFARWPANTITSPAHTHATPTRHAP